MQDDENNKLKSILDLQFKVQESQINILQKRMELENVENKKQQEKLLSEIKKLEEKKINI